MAYGIVIGNISFVMTSRIVNGFYVFRFCLDTEMLLSWCPCLEGSYPAVCHVNPCLDTTCVLHPNARCHINMCGTCSAEFFLDGRRVNCEGICI